MILFDPMFPIHRLAREKFGFDSPTFTDFTLARQLADSMNATRDLKNNPELTVKAGDLAAAALLDEIYSELISLYCQEVDPSAIQSAPAFLDGNLGELHVHALLKSLEEEFNFLKGRPEKIEFMLRLKLANLNPAFDNFSELFDESALPFASYEDCINALNAYFHTLPPFGEDELSLWDLLLLPIKTHPDNIKEQLKFTLQHFSDKINAKFATRVLVTFDLIAEENKPVFFGPGPAQVLDFRPGAGVGTGSMYGGSVGMEEFEAFTVDKEWMPRTVLIAKQTYVWLDQLSKKYDTQIYRLDQVPDAELDELASYGITGLWLIGVWQRSKASQEIKRMTGNPDAIASAYSLYSYDVAWEIGGLEALENLKMRAAARGIRMASDMVPNHMAIDSKWVVEKPDWFLSLPFAPFPHANFDTPDLCEDEDVSVYLEAGYYSKTDASVVFKRVQNNTGEIRYVYHGNDGTLMPWNDTAQLNYLLPEVREAAIQTIIAVAKQFPIIRFDAAMTLAKRHLRRLWFPSPGSGGDIPSRAGRGLTADEFDAAMPQEFWREVVDRIAIEAPDTLLLAEAFWLMEGYFVRTLGMHRVYNSAFMNMLRDEKNAEYRQTLRNTLEFDPDILNRFVNFINNPDEETAVEQFGKGDKYFGVCTLLSTLPGLPMFGHGQIEGYAEKYGMEYPRAYWNESPDEGLIGHHKQVIFPLLHKRYIFAGSENFTLYDFWNEGHVNENVFAYSNRFGNERALVVYNNSYTKTSGWIKGSVGFAQKKEDGTKDLAVRQLGEQLGVSYEERCYLIFRDNTSGLEYLRKSKELVKNGLFVELKEYGCQVFLDFREVSDEGGLYERLAERLNGAGVPSVDIALREMLLEPIHVPFKSLCEVDVWREAFDGDAKALQARAEVFATAVGHFLKREVDAEAFARNVADAALPENVLPVSILFSKTEAETEDELEEALASSSSVNPEIQTDDLTDGAADLSEAATLLAYTILKEIGELSGEELGREKVAHWLQEWLLVTPLQKTLAEFEAPANVLNDLKIWLCFCGQTPKSLFALLSKLLADDLVQATLGINNFDRTIWFQGEGVDVLLETLEIGSALEGVELPLEELQKTANLAEYRVVKWMELARETAVAV
jgi:glycosidase